MKVLQFNLWNINEPLSERMETLAKGVSELRPDVVTFQEVSPVGGRPQIAELAENEGYFLYYADAGSFRGRKEGNAIMARVPAVSCETLNLGGAEVDLQRVALCCFFDGLLDARVAVVCTHFAYPLGADQERVGQARELAQFIETTGAAESFVLGADLNATPDSRAVGEILAIPGAEDAWHTISATDPQFTFAADNPYVEERLGPNRRIDYVISGGKLTAAECSAVFTAKHLGIASDHYGIVADIELR